MFYLSVIVEIICMARRGKRRRLNPRRRSQSAPAVSLRRGDNTSQDRMDAINSETLEHYFTLLKKTLEENNLKNSPQRIYNVDESGVPLDPKGLT